MTVNDPLPIDAVLPAIQSALATNLCAVLVAPPGAGKTTRVPLALLGAPWLAGQKIIVLEPRRLAARGASARMAQTLGQPSAKPSASAPAWAPKSQPRPASKSSPKASSPA